MKVNRQLASALVFVFGSMGMLAIPATAATKPLSVESFFQRDDVDGMAVSPSGRWLAIQAGEPGGRVSLKIIDLEEKEPTKVIAKFSRFDVTDFSWVNDDWLVFSLFDENDRSGKSSGTGLVSVRRDGEKMRSLIKREFETLFQEHGNVALEPYNEMLARGAPGTNEIIIGEEQYDTNYSEFEGLLLRRMDVSTGATRTYFADQPAPPGKIRSWIFDGKGQARVALAYKDKKTTVYWLDGTGKQWRPIAEFDSLYADFSPAYVDDNDQLFVTVLNSATKVSELHKFDFASGKPEAEAVIAVEGFDVWPRPIRDPGKTKVYGVRVETEADGVAWFSDTMAAIQAKVDAALPGNVNHVTCHPCENPKSVLVFSYSDTNPGDYLMYWPGTGKFERLGSRRAQHHAEQMANVEFHRTKTRDGADLPVWITKTRDSDTSRKPAVVLVHGGPWARGGSWHWDAEAQFLASRGYVVIEPEFRGSTGYGDAHFRAGWKQWGQRMQDDVADGLRFAISKGWVDEKRVCIAGGSYGGYSTLMGLAKDTNKELYQCGVAWIAVTDPRFLYTVHWSDTSEAAKGHSMPEMMGDLKKDAVMLKENAPIELASKIKAPLLLAYGARDRRVPLVHGEKMRDALTEAGSPPEWVVYDKEGHGWVRTENKIDFWRRTEAFLAKYLK